jgi:hypothetical protein
MTRFMPRPVGTFGSDGRVDPDRVGDTVTLKASGQRWIVTQTTSECYVLRPMEDGRGTLLLTPKELEEHAAR